MLSATVQAERTTNYRGSHNQASAFFRTRH